MAVRKPPREGYANRPPLERINNGDRAKRNPGYLFSGYVQPETPPPDFNAIPRGTVWAEKDTPIHPDFLPYAKVPVVAANRDGLGRPREYHLYPAELPPRGGTIDDRFLDGPLAQGFDPKLLRQGEGWRFQKEHSRYPCPVGWVTSKDDPSYCERFGDPSLENRGPYDGPEKKDGRGLYSNKAYITKQNFQADQELPSRSHYSDSSYSRSHDPVTGDYVVFYEPNPPTPVTTDTPSGRNRKGKSDVDTYTPLAIYDEGPLRKKYDPSWYLPPRTTNKAPMKSGDSLLVSSIGV